MSPPSLQKLRYTRRIALIDKKLVRWYHGSVTNITWSDPDIFLYDMPRIVTDFDWEAKTFTYIRKDSIQTYKAGAFPEDYTAFTEAFLDACILAGGVYDCPVLPSLAGSLTSMGPVFTFERAIDILRTYNYDGATTIKESLPDSKEYLGLYAKTKAMITYMPIKQNDGPIVTLVRHNAPNDLAMVITPRLADSIYWMFYHRLVRPNIYDLLISDNIQIHAPLEGGDTSEYRNLLTEMIPIQTQCLALVASHSNRFMHHKHLVPSFPHRANCSFRLQLTGINRKRELIFLPITSSIPMKLRTVRPRHGTCVARLSHPLPRYSSSQARS